MNAFYEHHKDNIRFGYRCFDRLLLNADAALIEEVRRMGYRRWAA